MEKEKSEKEMGNEWIKKLFMIYRLSIIDYSNTQSIFYTNVPYQARNAINLPLFKGVCGNNYAWHFRAWAVDNL